MGWGLAQPNANKKKNSITTEIFNVLTLIRFPFVSWIESAS
jgi:hypothetical protein